MVYARLELDKCSVIGDVPVLHLQVVEAVCSFLVSWRGNAVHRKAYSQESKMTLATLVFTLGVGMFAKEESNEGSERQRQQQ